MAAIAPSGGLQWWNTQICLPLQDSDSTGTKFEGALVNALIFVVIVGAMTFVLFLLFKYKARPPPSDHLHVSILDPGVISHARMFSY